jgi:outer membrane lipoprotein-sorting protein
MIRYFKVLFVFGLLISFSASAADAEQLYYALREKVMKVKDYTAEVSMKIDVSYMKIPDLSGKMFFKAPDKMKMERKDGISILPKKNINLTLNNLIPSGAVTVIDVGTAVIGNKTVRILKVIPNTDNTGIVLTKIWIDETALLAVRTETTTKDEGTVVMDLEYGRNIAYALPDKVTITMDVKEYKLPKGATMDYGESTVTPATKAAGEKDHKGTIEIRYLNYKVNKGLDDAIFLSEDGKKR